MRFSTLNMVLAALLTLFLTACDEPLDTGIDLPQDKSSIIGCYSNEHTSSTIQIAEDAISFNGKQLYDRYDYGITGRRNLPTILVWPGMVFQYDPANKPSLSTRLYGDGEGPLNYSFRAGTDKRILEIVTIPDGELFNFVRAPCSGANS